MAFRRKNWYNSNLEKMQYLLKIQETIYADYFIGKIYCLYTIFYLSPFPKAHVTTSGMGQTGIFKERQYDNETVE